MCDEMVPAAEGNLLDGVVVNGEPDAENAPVATGHYTGMFLRVHKLKMLSAEMGLGTSEMYRNFHLL